MEGLRKGSLFSFLEQAGERGAPCAPAFPRIRRTACRGRETSCWWPVSVPPCRSRPPGRRIRPRGGPFSRIGPPCRFCLLPDGRWAICPCAPDAASCRKASYSAQRPARNAPVTGTQADPSRGGSVSPHGGRSGVCAPSHTGQDVPGRTGRYGPGRRGKSGFSGREQKSIAFCSGLGYGFSIVCGKWRHGAANPSRNQP